MNIADSIAGSVYYSPVSKALTPVQPPMPVQGTPKKQPENNYPQAVLTSTRAARESVQARAEVLIQRNAADESLSGRSRQAIASYRALDETHEREMISSLLGIDEYA
jgi:hypothetical protein